MGMLEPSVLPDAGSRCPLLCPALDRIFSSVLSDSLLLSRFPWFSATVSAAEVCCFASDTVQYSCSAFKGMIFWAGNRGHIFSSFAFTALSKCTVMTSLNSFCFSDKSVELDSAKGKEHRRLSKGCYTPDSPAGLPTRQCTNSPRGTERWLIMHNPFYSLSLSLSLCVCVRM